MSTALLKEYVAHLLRFDSAHTAKNEPEVFEDFPRYNTPGNFVPFKACRLCTTVCNFYATSIWLTRDGKFIHLIEYYNGIKLVTALGDPETWSIPFRNEAGVLTTKMLYIDDLLPEFKELIEELEAAQAA